VRVLAGPLAHAAPGEQSQCPSGWQQRNAASRSRDGPGIPKRSGHAAISNGTADGDRYPHPASGDGHVCAHDNANRARDHAQHVYGNADKHADGDRHSASATAHGNTGRANGHANAERTGVRHARRLG
jgi:hypothetical protein